MYAAAAHEPRIYRRLPAAGIDGIVERSIRR